MQIHESNFLISFVLLILSFGSIFFGFIFKDLLIGFGNTYLMNNNLFFLTNILLVDSEFLPFKIKIIPLFLGILGLFFLIFILKS
jgi:NADH-ubiquinone oxidoreductase chain 5